MMRARSVLFPRYGSPRKLPTPPGTVFPNGFGAQILFSVRPGTTQPVIWTHTTLRLRITLDDLRTEANGGLVETGEDFRLETIDGIALPFHKLAYNATTGLLDLIFTIPTWEANHAYFFQLFFGNPAIETDQSSALAFDGWIAAYDAATGVDLKFDANLVSSNVNPTTLFSAPAGDFATNSTQIGDFLILGSYTGLTLFTAVSGDAAMGSGGHGVAGLFTEYSNDDLLPYFFLRKQGSGYFANPPRSSVWIWQGRTENGSFRVESSNNAFTITTPQLICGTWQQDSLPTLFINGVEDESSFRGSVSASGGLADAVISSPIIIADGNFHIGTDNRGGADGDWDGKIGLTLLRGNALPPDAVILMQQSFTDASLVFAYGATNLATDENFSPVVAPQQFLNTDEATALDIDILAHAFDPQGNFISLTNVSGAVGGSVSIVSEQARFLPSAAGAASFLATVTDTPLLGEAKSSTAKIRVNVSAADAVPDAFSFPSATNVATSSTQTSSAVTITGLTVPSSVIVTGGQVSINGGAFTSNPTTIQNNQTLQLRGVASTNPSSSTNVSVTVGGIASSFTITTAAQSGGGGSSGPSNYVPSTAKSKLSFNSGCHGAINAMIVLRKNPANNKVREFDNVSSFTRQGLWSQNTPAHLKGQAELSGYGTPTAWQRMKDGCEIWNIGFRLFNAGLGSDANSGESAAAYARRKSIAAWPAKTDSNFNSVMLNSFISPSVPPGWSAGITNSATQKAQMMEVYVRAAAGWFDKVWSDWAKGVKAMLLAEGMSHVRPLLRPSWEGNKDVAYGNNHSIYVTYCCARGPSDVPIIQDCWQRFADVMRNEWANFLICHCPHRDTGQQMPKSIPNANWIRTYKDLNPNDNRPGSPTWDCMAVDYYDSLSTKGTYYNNGTNETRWTEQNAAVGSYGSLGLASWISIARAKGLKMGFGEWGVALEPGPLFQPGGDNPVFIQKMFEAFQDLASTGHMHYETYFAASPHNLTQANFPLARAKYQQLWGTLT